MKKRIIGILLCICMLAALLPMQAAAESEVVEYIRANFGTDYTFKGGKTYRICLNDDNSFIVVEKGATLTVEPGAIIEFGVNGNVHDSEGKNTGDRLYVRGTLKLLGTEEDPVIVRPQYDGDWANCTGIVLERDETGGKVCLEASYTSFTGGGMEGRMWEGGIISIHGWGDMEQSYSLKLDHCSLQGSSHPWEYPDIYNSPDGTYALGFHPESYAAAIFVSAESNPVDVQLNDCTFGAEDLPIGKAIQDSGYTRDPALHDWKITNCTFTNTKKPDGSDRGSVGVVNITCPRDLTITGCTFEPSEALPTPLYFNNNVRFRAKAGIRVIENNEICYTANEQTFYGTNYGVGYTNMPLCLSGVPLKELNVQEGQLVIPDIGGEGMWSYAGFNLCIADGGRLNVAPDATISLDGSANRYYRMELGKDAAVNGLELYGVDGVTPISYPTAEPMSFVYLSPSYNDEPYSGLPTGKWVRVTEAHTPVSGVEIFEGEEVWLTSGAATPSVLHAFALPEDAYDTAAFWITTNDISSDALQCNKEAVYDSNRKCYLPTVVKVSYSKTKPTDETLCAYSRDGALIDTILVHFRSSDDPEMTSVTGVSLPTDVTLPAGQSMKLPMSVLPEDATTKNVWWVSGDERYVTVDQNGVITAVKEGTAIIAVTTLDNPTTAKCTVTVTKAEEPENDYFGLWMCDAEHNPNTGGGVSILYELPDGTIPADSGTYWTSSTNQTVPHGTKVTLIANIDPKYQFKGWYQANIDRASPEDPYYLENKPVSAEMEYTFVGNPIGEGEAPYICAVFEYTGIERQADQIQVWVGNTDGRDTNSSGMGGKVAVKYTPSEPNVYGLRTLDGTDFVAGEIVQFYKGDEITACAKPDDGYIFVGWYHVNIEWGPGNGKSYEGEVISTEDSFTYKPGETVVPGDTEPLRYVCAVFEEAPATCVHANTEIRNAAEPTCTEPGYTGDTYCVDCGAKLATGEAIAALGHKWDDGKVTTAPTATKDGVKTYTCSRCGATKTETIPATGEKTNPFKDVKEGDFFYDAVLWAVNADPQVTSGTSATTFSPADTCTRAQVVTFLWRAKGCPEPKSSNNPFKDVKEGEYYYKAVLWAVENNITAGTSATTFSPNAGCTRAQVVTFLWRTEGQPKPTSSANPFKDVTGGYYYDAVLWAVEKNITAGTSATTFSPDNTCTRGQIVTFLFRAFAG